CAGIVASYRRGRKEKPIGNGPADGACGARRCGGSAGVRSLVPTRAPAGRRSGFSGRGRLAMLERDGPVRALCVLSICGRRGRPGGAALRRHARAHRRVRPRLGRARAPEPGHSPSSSVASAQIVQTIGAARRGAGRKKKHRRPGTKIVRPNCRRKARGRPTIGEADMRIPCILLACGLATSATAQEAGSVLDRAAGLVGQCIAEQTAVELDKGTAPRQFATVLRENCRAQEQRFRAMLTEGLKKEGSFDRKLLRTIDELLSALRQQSVTDYADLLKQRPQVKPTRNALNKSV